MASAFFDSLMASGGGWKHPPEISKTRNGMTMKFLPLVSTYMEEAQNEIFFLTNLAWSVNYRQKSRKSQFLEMKLLSMLTSQHFAGLSILTSEMIPENLRSISRPIRRQGVRGQKNMSNLFCRTHCCGFNAFYGMSKFNSVLKI